MWTASQARHVELLREHVNRYGTALVPHSRRLGNFRLGAWVTALRIVHRRGGLTPEQVRFLENPRRFPGWTWEPRQDQWRRAVAAFRRFVRRAGHATIPSGHREGGLRLAWWVTEQRVAHREGRLSAAREAELEALPQWTWDTREQFFREGAERIEQFVRREGHAQVPAPHRERGFPLGQWVNRLRRRHALGLVPASRARFLERLPGWSWRPLPELFRAGLEALRRFSEREGHCRVPDHHREGNVALGTWVSNRRRDHRLGRLAAENRRSIETVPGWSWRVREDRFVEGLRVLRAFVRREGHARPSQQWREAGFPLGSWVATRRSEHRHGELLDSRAKLLERLPGWTWGPRADGFARALVALRSFVRRKGHARVPQGHVEAGFQLGSWVSKARTAYRAGRLTPERVRRLAGLPGWTWEPQRARFEERLATLRAYARRAEHARPPQGHVEGGFDLGGWVSYLRNAHRRGRLPAQQARKLECLPGWSWDPVEERFQEGLHKLRRFVAREGHTRVPVGHAEDGFLLGLWARHRRREKAQGRLAAAHARALSSVPGRSWRSSRRRRSG